MKKGERTLIRCMKCKVIAGCITDGYARFCNDCYLEMMCWMLPAGIPNDTHRYVCDECLVKEFWGKG